MSYKDRLSDWTKETARECRAYLPSSFSVSSFLAEMKSVSDDVAKGMCQGLKYAITSNSGADKKQDNHPYVRMHTRRYGDGSVVIFDPHTGKTFAHYGLDGKGLPFFRGFLNPEVTGRAGVIGNGGVFNLVADGDPVNYDSGRHYKYGSREAQLRAYQKAA